MPKICLPDLVDVDLIVTDFAVLNVIETVDQICDGRLSCTGRTDKCNLMSGFCIK